MISLKLKGEQLWTDCANVQFLVDLGNALSTLIDGMSVSLAHQIAARIVGAINAESLPRVN